MSRFFRVVAVLVMIALPGVVWAQAQPSAPATFDWTNPFSQAPDGDLYMYLLSLVVPDAGPVKSSIVSNSGAAMGLKLAFGIFCSVMLLIAALFGAWNIISGIVAAAREGSTFGRRYSGTWAPIRFVIGFGMLVPIAGGLCFAQALALYLAMWGSNLASQVWKTNAYTTLNQANTSTAESVQVAVNYGSMGPANTTIKALFERELCGAAINSYMKYVRNTNYDPRPDRFIASNRIGSVTYTLDYGSACGSLIVDVPDQTGAVSSVLFSARGNAENDNKRQMAIAQIESIIRMASHLRPIADQAAQTYVTTTGTAGHFFGPNGQADRVLLPAMISARKDYMDTVSRTARDIFNKQNANSGAGRNYIEETKSEVSKKGWAAAGIYYLSISRVDSSLYSYISQGATANEFNKPSLGSSTPSIGLEKVLLGENVNNIQNLGVMTDFRNWLIKSMPQIAPDLSGRGFNIGPGGNEINSISWLVLDGVEKLDVKADNPLTAMQSVIDYGNVLLNWGGAILTATKSIGILANATSASKVAGLAEGASGFLSDLGAWVTWLSILAIVIGALFAIVLPLIPAFKFSLAVLACLVRVLEALVAAPLWCLFLMRLDGDEFVHPSTAPGFKILFAIFLKPPLVVFGFIVSLTAFGASMVFFSQVLGPTMTALASGVTLGPVSFAVLLVLKGAVLWSVAMLCFDLIERLPAEVTQWFNGASFQHQGGEAARQISSFVTGQISGGYINRAVSAAATGMGTKDPSVVGAGLKPKKS